MFCWWLWQTLKLKNNGKIYLKRQIDGWFSDLAADFSKSSLLMWIMMVCFELTFCLDWYTYSNSLALLQIAAICQEAGMHAVRKNRYVILPKDFEKGYRTNVKKPDTNFEFYKWEILKHMGMACILMASSLVLGNDFVIADNIWLLKRFKCPSFNVNLYGILAVAEDAPFRVVSACWWGKA